MKSAKIFIISGLIVIAAGLAGCGGFSNLFLSSLNLFYYRPGNHFWTTATTPTFGYPAGFVQRTTHVYNKPFEPVADASITTVAVLPDATELTLEGTQGRWCQVKGTLNGTGDDKAVKPFEGWVFCDGLINHQPTPYPTATPIK